MRTVRADANALQHFDLVARDAAGRRLVSAGWIGEAVADNPGAGFQRRADQLVEMIAPRSVEHECLGERPPLAKFGRRRQNEFAERFSAGRAAGLPGANHFKAAIRKPGDERRGEGWFPDALASFQGDEPAP